MFMKNFIAHNSPLVSIIVPCRNEERFVDRCLDSIIAQDYPKDKLEVLVVDGMSEDGTREIVEEYAKRHPFIRLLDNPEKITPCAFNLGIKRAKGSFIAIVGAHNYISNNYLSTAVDYLQSNEVDGVGSFGVCIPIDNKFISKPISIVMQSKFGVGSSFRTNCPKEVVSADTVASPVYKREVFKKIGLFDEDLVRGQDAEINARLRKNGGIIILVPEVVSYYYARDSLGKLWKQHFQYGYFKPLLVKKVGKIFTLRQLIPPLFVGSLIASLVSSAFFKPLFGLFLFVSGSYIIANLGFSFKLSFEKGLEYLFALPSVFATLHFSYGIGYLKGIWDFVIFKKDKKGKIKDMPLTR